MPTYKCECCRAHISAPDGKFQRTLSPRVARSEEEFTESVVSPPKCTTCDPRLAESSSATRATCSVATQSCPAWPAPVAARCVLCCWARSKDGAFSAWGGACGSTRALGTVTLQCLRAARVGGTLHRANHLSVLSVCMYLYTQLPYPHGHCQQFMWHLASPEKLRIWNGAPLLMEACSVVLDAQS